MDSHCSLAPVFEDWGCRLRLVAWKPLGCSPGRESIAGLVGVTADEAFLQRGENVEANSERSHLSVNWTVMDRTRQVSLCSDER
jgi:hypothetical protein